MYEFKAIFINLETNEEQAVAISVDTTPYGRSDFPDGNVELGAWQLAARKAWQMETTTVELISLELISC